MIAVAPIIAVASTPITFRYDYLTSVELPALAVSSEGGGVVTNLTVTVAYPGSGQVYFSSDPVTELDTQSAARIAVLVATSFLGIDYKKYDYFFSMKSPSLVIGGPSASAVMSVGVVAAIMNATVKNDVAMTGMINPDGTIGPVGGIPDKLQAAAAAGYKTLLVPVGQLIVTETQLVSQSTPFGTIYRTVTNTVNLTQLGEKLGVSVIEVTTLRDALSYFLENVYFPKQQPSNITYTDEQKELFNQWRGALLLLYNQSASELVSLSNIYKSSVDMNVVNSYVNQSSYYYSTSNTLWEEGKYYSSLNSLYQADIYLNTAIIFVRTTLDPNLIQTYVNDINSSLTSLRENALQSNVKTFSELESYLIIMDRLDNAETALNSAVNNIYKVYDLSLGKWRTVLADPLDLAIANLSQYTIQNWLSYKNLPSPTISKEFLDNIADYYLQYAKSVITYYESLASEVNVSTDVQQLNTLYNNAVSMFYSGNVPASLYYSISAVSISTLDLHLIFNSDLKSIVNAEISNVKSNLGEAGYISAVVLGYSEQAKEYLDQYNSTGNVNYLYRALTLSLDAGIYGSLLNIGRLYGQTVNYTQPAGTTENPSQTTTVHTNTTSATNSTLLPAASSLNISGNGPIILISAIIVVFVIIAYYYTRKGKAGTMGIQVAQGN
ncbi:MAG: hypothetical protein JHC28_04170 [Thermoprotei archaeon]|nr:hypothetical protein [Thermoprotei archaeon]